MYYHLLQPILNCLLYIALLSSKILVLAGWNLEAGNPDRNFQPVVQGQLFC